jgi:hypothetical protein
VQTTPSTETDDRRATLEAFARALRREMHPLAERPELTWQQLHNRLQWEGDAIAELLADERQRRSRPGARPWIHRYSRLRESEALVRILGGQADNVDDCAVSPDGTWIVSAGSTLKIWDVASGSERATLAGHTDSVLGCAVSPDGSRIVSAGLDEREKWRRSGGPGTAASTWQCGNARLARWLRASLAIGARTPPSSRSPHPAPLT